MAALIDGKAAAARLVADVARGVAALRASHGITPGLAVVLVGENPASAIYVRSKAKRSREAGMASFEHRLPADAPEAQLLALVAGLNADPAVHGILVQLPLPPHTREAEIFRLIDPAKDVDGFHPVNAGLLTTGQAAFVPCTPMGAMCLIRSVLPSLAGAEAVVIGRSKIVGKPMAMLLLAADATVTLTHSRTRDIAAACRRADVLVAAVGRPEMIRGDWIKPGAVVIDVGINRLADGQLVGDVAFAEAGHAMAITPVPGGVGPMTIACLLANTLQAAQAGTNIRRPRSRD